MMTWVSISGTALSIFLVMSLFMTEQVKTAEVAPESNRNRIMTGQGIHVTSSTDGDGSTMGLNPNFIKKFMAILREWRRFLLPECVECQ